MGINKFNKKHAEMDFKTIRILTILQITIGIVIGVFVYFSISSVYASEWIALMISILFILVCLRLERQIYISKKEKSLNSLGIMMKLMHKLLGMLY